MGNNTQVRPEEIRRQLRGVIAHLKAANIQKHYGSFAEAMEDLNLWDFAFNQAEVQAYAYAANRDLQNLIHKGKQQ